MILKIAFILLLVVFIVMCIAYRYRNPYKLIMVFGKKGSGKSTLLTKLALKYQKAGRPVYANTAVPGCYLINALDVGFFDIPKNAVIFIDEASMYWDNRNFKNFKKEYQDYFRYQRQYRHTVYLFSQSFDVDKKLRDLCDQMYLVKCYLNVFSVARRVNKTITIVHADSGGTGESHIADDLAFDSLFFFWAGSVRITWIPKYTKFFKSYNPPPLPEGKEPVLCPPAVRVKKDWRYYVLLSRMVLFSVRTIFFSLPVVKKCQSVIEKAKVWIGSRNR